MHGSDVAFHFFPCSGGNYRSTFVVDQEHELSGLFLGVFEIVNEYIGDIGHEINGIVPDCCIPWAVGFRVKLPINRG